MPTCQEAEAPWERKPEESSKAFEAFAVYRDMGAARSFENVAKQLSKSAVLIRRWAAQHAWEERARLYDIALDKRVYETIVQEKQAMVARHIRMAMELQDMSFQALKKIDPEKASPKVLLDCLVKAIEIERTSRTADTKQGDDPKTSVEIIIEGDRDDDSHC